MINEREAEVLDDLRVAFEAVLRLPDPNRLHRHQLQAGLRSFQRSLVLNGEIDDALDDLRTASESSGNLTKMESIATFIQAKYRELETLRND